MRIVVSCLVVIALAAAVSRADDIKKSPLYARLKASLDAVPAIDNETPPPGKESGVPG